MQDGAIWRMLHTISEARRRSQKLVHELRCPRLFRGNNDSTRGRQYKKTLAHNTNTHTHTHTSHAQKHVRQENFVYQWTKRFTVLI